MSAIELLELTTALIVLLLAAQHGVVAQTISPLGNNGAFTICEATAYSSVNWTSCFRPVTAEWGNGTAAQGNVKITIDVTGPLPKISSPYPAITNIDSITYTPTQDGVPLSQYMDPTSSPDTTKRDIPASVTFPVPWHGGSLQEVLPNEILTYDGISSYIPDPSIFTSADCTGGKFVFNYQPICGDIAYSTKLPRNCVLRSDILTNPSTYQNISICDSYFENSVPAPLVCSTTEGYTYPTTVTKEAVVAAETLSRCSYTDTLPECAAWGTSSLTRDPQYNIATGKGIFLDVGYPSQTVGTVTWIPPTTCTAGPVYLKQTEAYNRDHYAPISIKAVDDFPSTVAPNMDRIMAIPGFQTLADAPRPQGSAIVNAASLFTPQAICRNIYPINSTSATSSIPYLYDYMSLTAGAIHPANIPAQTPVFALVTGTLPASHYLVYGDLQFSRPGSSPFSGASYNGAQDSFLRENSIRYFVYPATNVSSQLQYWSIEPVYWNSLRVQPTMFTSSDLAHLPPCACNVSVLQIPGNVICNSNYELVFDDFGGIAKPSSIAAPATYEVPACSISLDESTRTWFGSMPGYVLQETNYNFAVTVDNKQAVSYRYKWHTRSTTGVIVNIASDTTNSVTVTTTGSGLVVLTVSVTELGTLQTGTCSIQLSSRDACTQPVIKGSELYILGTLGTVLDGTGATYLDQTHIFSYNWVVVDTVPAGLSSAAQFSSPWTAVTMFNATTAGTYYVALRLTARRTYTNLPPYTKCLGVTMFKIRATVATDPFLLNLTPDNVVFPVDCFNNLGNSTTTLPPTYTQLPDLVQPPKSSLQPISATVIAAREQRLRELRNGANSITASGLLPQIGDDAYNKFSTGAIVVGSVLIGIVVIGMLLSVKWSAFIKSK